MNTIQSSLYRILLIIAGSLFIAVIPAQEIPDTLKGRNLYRPGTDKTNQTENYREQPAVNYDSIAARQEFIQDSIAIRMQFVRDSLIAREKFVRDSIQRRERILDSLNFLKAQLPRLIDACLKTVEEDMIIDVGNVVIIGDSILSNYTYRILPFNMTLPFTPWKGVINLSDKPIIFEADYKRKIIKSMQTPFINCSFSYNPRGEIVVINQKSTILNKRNGKFYKTPVDSVFFDKKGRIVKIKRYVQLNTVSGSYQKGPLILLHLSQVKQYQYGSGNEFTKLQIVNFCERWSKADEHKVCNIVDYDLTKQGNNYTLSQKNNPANNYSDGTFIFEFDNIKQLQHISFKNIVNTENWKTTIEVNEAGNVSRYIYRKNDKVNKTLLVNYYLDDPHAKHKVETVTCVFEDDGISYYQKNNTTGKSRMRDRVTGKWSEWQ